jgi:hypothetical protein
MSSFVICRLVAANMLFVQHRPVGRPPGVPAAQVANFGLLDLQLTEAGRRPVKLPLQLGELPIEPVEERPQARCGLRRSRPCAYARHRQTVNEWPVANPLTNMTASTWAADWESGPVLIVGTNASFPRTEQ